MKAKVLKYIKILACLLLLAALLLVGIIAYYGEVSARSLDVTEYTVKSEKVESGFRAVQLSDLHGAEIGEDNSLVVGAVKEAEPHLILMTGDMFSRSGEGYEEAVSLVEALRGIAPIYYTLGNHEDDHFRDFPEKQDEMVAKIEKAGAVVLEHEYEDIEVNGDKVRLGGFFGFAMYPDPDYFAALQSEGYLDNVTFGYVWRGGRDDAFLKNYLLTDSFTLLMCHIPESYILWNGFYEYPADLVLSGHLHGGQIILPVLGPVYAPDQGLFPEKTEGLFQGGEGSSLVLSRGLGSGKVIPRMNNLPEMVIINVEP